MENAWGPLGNPTKEQIALWQNMPYGSFKSMVKNLPKKSKTAGTYVVRLTKRIVTCYTAEKEFYATSLNDAENKVTQLYRDVRDGIKQLDFTLTEEDKVEYSYGNLRKLD